MIRVHQLKSDRAQAVVEMRAALNAGQNDQFETLAKKIEDLDTRIRMEERADTLQQMAAASTDHKFEGEVRGRYNLLKAVSEVASGHGLTGFEKECDSEIRSRNGGGDAKAIQIPMSVIGIHGAESRVMTAADAASAGNTVFTQQGPYVDRLRVQPVVQRLGATLLTGLQGKGDVVLPRNISGAQAAWYGETATINPEDAQYDQVVLSAKSVAAEYRMSNLLMAQNSVALSDLLAADLQKAIALKIDGAAINGAGSATVPKGIMNAVAQSTSAEANFSKLAADLLGAIDQANDSATGILVTTALMNAVRKGAFDTTGQPIPVASLFHGFTPAQTNQLTSSTMIAGNWSSLLIGVWNSFQLLVDPYSLSSTQQVKLVASAHVDVGLRHPESFVWKTLANPGS